MSDLFVRRSALISPCGFYRYWLRRAWDDNLPVLVVCMLNPSTADHERDDPTLMALTHFAKLWGFGGLWIVNLNAWRSSSPVEMMRVRAPFGPDNGAHIEAALDHARATTGRMLVAWGNGGDFDDRAEWLASRALGLHRLELLCLGRSLANHPKHPMARGKHRIPRDQMPMTWRKPS